MAGSRKIEVEIVGDTKSLERALGRAQGKTASFGDKIGKASRGAAIGLGVLGAGAWKATQSASDLNEVVNKTQVIFGKSADDIMRFGENAAQSIGLSERAALEAASTYGTFAKAAGLVGEDVAGFSVSLTKAAADLASFHNADISQVLEDIRSGLAGETEPLRKYGILLNDAAMRQEALKMGLIKTTKDALTPQNKTLVAQRLILHSLGPAFGDFSRTADGAANQQRIMAAETENASATLGEALLPTVQAAQAAFISLTGVLGRHTQTAQILIGAVAALGAIILVVNAAVKAHAAAQAIATAFKWAFVTSVNAETGAVIRASAASRVAAAASAVWTAAQWLLNAALSANPIGLVIVAIAALAVGLVIAYKRSETFRNVVTAAFNAVKAVAGAAVSFISNHWRTLVALIPGIGVPLLLVIKHFGRIRAAGSAALGFITGKVNALRDAFWTVVGAVQAVINKIQDLIDKIPDIPGIPSVDIPGFASGGIVPGPRGAPRLIMAHGGETILPTHRGAASVAGGGDVFVDVRISEEVVGKIADVRISRANRGTAKTLRAGKTWEPS